MVCADLVTKNAAVRVLEAGDKPLIPGVARLTLTYNTGTAFSFMAGHPELALGLSVTVLVALLLFVVFAKLKKAETLALGAVIAGGFSNALERLMHGSVTDMLKLEFMSFPVFNFADICVTAGCCVFAVLYLFTGKKEAGSSKKERL